MKKDGVLFGLIFIFSFCYISCKQVAEPEKTKPLFIEKLPESIQSKIIWFCDYEDNNFSKWEDYGTDGYYSGGGIYLTDEANSIFGIQSSIVNSGKKAAYTTIKNDLIPGQKKAIRLMRWTDKPWDKDGKYFPVEAYYSTFFFMEYLYNPEKDKNNDPFNDGGWWNIFQFKSKNFAGSHPIVSFDPYVENNQMFLAMIIKDYQNDYSDDYIQEYLESETKTPIIIKQWNHLEVYYKKDKGYNGKIIAWLNGKKIFEKNNVRTVLPADETAVWGIGNYTDFIQGGPKKGEATIYFDDAIISTVKISDYLYLLK